MSRLLKKLIKLPEGVSITETEGGFVLKGPKGELTLPLLPYTSVNKETDGLKVGGKGGGKRGLANCGTMWALLRNAVIGVSEGFTRVLIIEGVGYRVQIEGQTVVLGLGFSHPIRYELPEGIEAKVEKNKITISGINKEIVGKAASEIRAFRKPEPYKGKGIHYEGEVIRRKVGKRAAAGAE